MRRLGFVIAALAALILAGEAQAEQKYRFAVVPKAMNNPFFDLARDGCRKRAEEIGNMECVYVGPLEYDPAMQARIILDLIGQRIDGLAISVSDAEAATGVIRQARDAGIPVITFDADAPDSARQAYIGTDNRGFGRRLGEQLKKLRPEGGTYGMISGWPGAANLAERVAGIREALEGSAWREIETSPLFCNDDAALSVRQMAGLAAAHPDLNAIIPVGGWPMFAPDAYKAFVDMNRKAYDEGRLLLVVADTLKVQLELLKQGYANTLVGQRPFEMGEKAMDILLALRQGRSVPEIAYSGLDIVTPETVDRFLD